MITSMAFGGTTPVCSLYTMEKPWEKYRASPFFKHGLTWGHIIFCPASEIRYCTIVPFLAASSTSKRVLPGTQPSAAALSYSRLNLGDWPTITRKPLSRMFKAWAGPWTP